MRAQKMYVVGMEKHAEKPEFVLAYLDFLYYTGNDTNMRAVIERALKEVPADKCEPIWERYLRFETTHGDLAKVCRA